MAAEAIFTPKRQWNGYGLSWWRCRCGAARRVTGMWIKGDRIDRVESDPCKRCGDENEPHCIGDPWAGTDDA